MLVKELQSLGLAVELRYEDERGIPAPRFTYAEEEEEDIVVPEGAAVLPPAPSWEVDFDPTDETDADVAPEVRMDLGAYAHKANEENGDPDQD